MPSSSSWWSSGTVIVERMPCMMIECAAENRLSIVASDDSTDGLVGHDLGHDDLRQDDAARSCRRASWRSSAPGRPSSISRITPRSAGTSSNAFVDDLRAAARGSSSRPIDARQLVGDAQPLVVAAQDLDVADLASRAGSRRRRRLDLLADVAPRSAAARSSPSAAATPAAGFSWNIRRVEPSMISSPSLQEVLADALAAQERAVQAAEIAEQVAAVGLAQDLGVLLRDDAVEDLERVVGMAPDRVEGAELELASLRRCL